MRPSDWTQDYFDDTYRRLFLDTVDPLRTESQIGQLLKLCSLLPGARVLDVGCGIGRHSLALASRGFNVTGVDMNPSYISICRQRAAALGVTADFRVADSRTMSLDLQADLAVSLWSSFGYYGENGDLQVLKRIAEHVRTGGHILIDVENRDYIVKHFVPQEWRVNGDDIILERRRFDAVEGTVSTKRIVVSGTERHEYGRVLRMYTARELNALLDSAGLCVEHWYGDYDGSRLGSESKRMIVIAVR
jgi:SAM-dependent methyltransferase